jgi:hypothetical protein
LVTISMRCPGDTIDMRSESQKDKLPWSRGILPKGGVTEENSELYVINRIVLTGITNNEIAHHAKDTGVSGNDFSSKKHVDAP